MTHNTQINKRDADIETIINVGRTNNHDIYVDIRVYKTGDVIDVGDITLTQAQWDNINDNLDLNNPKRFRCPECGDIVTEDEILRDLTLGGFGMCTCLYGDGRRALIQYEPYVSNELKPAITSSETELVKTIRKLCDKESI